MLYTGVYDVVIRQKKKYMCVYGHPTHPIFQPPTLTFFIDNYSTLIFANDPINFYNVNKGVFCLIISYLQIKSYNVLNYNNCSTDWSFPLRY